MSDFSNKVHAYTDSSGMIYLNIYKKDFYEIAKDFDKNLIPENKDHLDIFYDLKENKFFVSYVDNNLNDKNIEFKPKNEKIKNEIWKIQTEKQNENIKKLFEESKIVKLNNKENNFTVFNLNSSLINSINNTQNNIKNPILEISNNKDIFLKNEHKKFELKESEKTLINEIIQNKIKLVEQNNFNNIICPQNSKVMKDLCNYYESKVSLKDLNLLLEHVPINTTYIFYNNQIYEHLINNNNEDFDLVKKEAFIDNLYKQYLLNTDETNINIEKNETFKKIKNQLGDKNLSYEYFEERVNRIAEKYKIKEELKYNRLNDYSEIEQFLILKSIETNNLLGDKKNIPQIIEELLAKDYKLDFQTDKTVDIIYKHRNNIKFDNLELLYYGIGAEPLAEYYQNIKKEIELQNKKFFKDYSEENLKLLEENKKLKEENLKIKDEYSKLKDKNFNLNNLNSTYQTMLNSLAETSNIKKELKNELLFNEIFNNLSKKQINTLISEFKEKSNELRKENIEKNIDKRINENINQKHRKR